MNYLYSVPVGGNQQNTNSPQPNQPQIIGQIPPELVIGQMVAQIRNMTAQARFNESVVLLNGMAEIRAALNIPSVSNDDTGLSERVPLKPMFEPEQMKTLQIAYLAFSEKYLSFANHALTEMEVIKTKNK
jgi:hypothetical protein